MSAYILRRLGLALLTLLGISLVTFMVLHLAPGEPLPGGDPERHPADAATIAAMRHRYGLHRPLAVQYVHWIGRLARLDLGDSFVDHRPVRDKILERLPHTVLLNLAALLFIIMTAVPLGVSWARHQGSLTDRLGGPVLYFLYSLPSFWVALLLQGSLAVGLGLFPLDGLRSDGAAGWPWPWRAADAAWHMVLPAFCLGYGSLAFFARFSRANLLEILTSDFIRQARCRGLPESRILWKHALAAISIPFITLGGLLLPTLVSGSVIIERIFSWPGLGSLLFDSLSTRDYPTILGLTSLAAFLVLAGTLGADLLYLLADPRLRRPGDPR